MPDSLHTPTHEPYVKRYSENVPRLCTWPNCDCGGAQGIVEDCPKEEGLFCACGNELHTEAEQRDQVCRECL